ncbi:MAG TPA: DUF885 domain-containing protein [Thermoanaerobaculia bacterium]|nr:DUF885 domain-containing protein [Thermoanaerobaculia bacterium]
MSLLLPVLILSALGGALGPATLAAGAAGAAKAADASPAAALHALFAEEWQYSLREDPLAATAVGDNRYNDRLPSMTPADLARRDEHARDVLERLHRIGRARLDEADAVSYDLFERALSDEISEYRFKTYRQSITAEGGFHTDFSRLPEEAPLATLQDYDNYLARLRAFPAYARQNTELLREGVAAGHTLPRVVLRGYTDAIAMHVVDDVTKSIFWRPFASFPAAVPESERERLRQAGGAAIRDAVVPAYRDFLAFMRDEYIPHARTTIAAADLPDGRALYAFEVHHFTTLELAPEAVHAIGLREVERIHGEMLAVMRQVDWKQGLPEFLEFLRTDPRFYARTPAELLERAAYIAKRMDGKLPSLFKVLPRQPYTVEPVPADIAPKYTGGRYNGAPLDSRRAGTYWVNTFALDTRPLYNLEALTFHEAVPGHHLQIALQKELRDLPDFRRFVYVDAFGEGWGLYSEWLGLEAGFYRDPYSNFGRLSYEMWRACRLVVDTGIHAMGWSRQRAIDYLAANTALSRHEVETEVDRYISWPGQALSYKMGEMKIKELRRAAEAALGTRFDVRDFHDAVLRNGTVTLPVLERQVHAYIHAAGAASANAAAAAAAP